MPTNAELFELAKVLYNTSNIYPSGGTYGLTLDTSKAASMGFSIWSGDEFGHSAYYRDFIPDGTGSYTAQRNMWAQALCIGD